MEGNLPELIYFNSIDEREDSLGFELNIPT